MPLHGLEQRRREDVPKYGRSLREEHYLRRLWSHSRSLEWNDQWIRRHPQLRNPILELWTAIQWKSPLNARLIFTGLGHFPFDVIKWWELHSSISPSKCFFPSSSKYIIFECQFFYILPTICWLVLCIRAPHQATHHHIYTLLASRNIPHTGIILLPTCDPTILCGTPSHLRPPRTLRYRCTPGGRSRTWSRW